MTELLFTFVAFVAGAGFAAYRLKGSLTFMAALRRVVPFGGGGPGPHDPK